MLGEWINNLVESFFYISFMNQLFENRKRGYRGQWGTVVATGLLFLNITLADRITVFHWSTTMIDCIVILIYAYLYLYGSWLGWIAGAFLFNVGLLGSVAVSMGLSVLYTSNGLGTWLTFGSVGRNLLLIFSKGFLLVYMYIILKCKRLIYKDKAEERMMRCGVFLIPLVTVCMASLSIELLLKAYWSQENIGIFITLLSGVFILTVTIIYLYAHAMQEKERIHENQLLLEMLNFQRSSFKKEIHNYEKVIKIEHDMKNYLLGIRHYIEQEDRDTALNSLNKILSQLTSVEEWIISTENQKTLWGSVINMKAAAAKEHGISIAQNIFPGRYERIDSLDLCVVLGNLLDNAAEAEERNTYRKEIIIEMRESQSLLYIFVSNWIDDACKEEAKRMTSRKQDSALHGVGLSSVREVVKKYEGKFEVGMEGDYFKAKVIVPIFDKNE